MASQPLTEEQQELKKAWDDFAPGWWEEDFSWDGLAKKEVQGRGTLQDYWRTFRYGRVDGWAGGPD